MKRSIDIDDEGNLTVLSSPTERSIHALFPSTNFSGSFRDSDSVLESESSSGSELETGSVLSMGESIVWTINCISPLVIVASHETGKTSGVPYAFHPVVPRAFPVSLK